MDLCAFYAYLIKLIISACLFPGSVSALKCKCTQSSASIECSDGVCQVESVPAACLMLNHQTTGVHYACSGSELPDGKCQERVTKSGATVSVCSCASSDFCNQKLWPIEQGSSSSGPGEAEASLKIHSSGSSATSYTALKALVYLLSSFLVLVFTFNTVTN